MTNAFLARWVSDFADAGFSKPEDIDKKLTRFERRIRRRNFVEYLAGAVTIPTLCWIAWLTAREGEIIIPLGFAMVNLGMAVVLASLFYRAGNLPHHPEVDCRSHLRMQLERQQVALASVVRWYLAPLVPGMIVIMVGTTLPVARDVGWGIAMVGIAPVVAGIFGFFGFVWWLNLHTARQIGRRIEALDACDSEFSSEA